LARAPQLGEQERLSDLNKSVFSLRTESRMLGSIVDGKCMVMIP